MPVATQEGVLENLRFLILEVRKQLEKTKLYCDQPSRSLAESVLAKDDYIDNLKDIIQRKCFDLAAEAVHDDAAGVDYLKAIDEVGINLERIADFSENILSQAQYVENLDILVGLDFSDFFDPILEAIDRIEAAVVKRDVRLALKICRTEYDLDRRYARAFRRMLEELERGEDIQTYVTIIFIYRYLERMGDSLLNIGEAIISAALGEKIKIDRFWALEDSLEDSELDESIGEVTLEPVGETRSGCKISRVRRKSVADGERPVIFKEGRLAKLLAEKESVERWNTIMPGLVPQIYSFHDQDDHGSILFEYLPGKTFEELLMNGPVLELRTALAGICDVLPRVWRATREDRPTRGRFMEQLGKRLPDVWAVHPEFQQPNRTIGGLDAPSFERLVEMASEVDARLSSPFAVWIHGDFNVDNVIFDEAAGRVHFIDLYRSRPMDYVQDVSVFLVSNYRLQVFEESLRRRINQTMSHIYDFAAEFAAAEGDTTFGARLALGLARSFATSTRFVLDKRLAKSMFMRSRYLLEQLVNCEPETFEIAPEVLVD